MRFTFQSSVVRLTTIEEDRLRARVVRSPLTAPLPLTRNGQKFHGSFTVAPGRFFLDPVDTPASAGNQGRTSQITSSYLLFPVSMKPTT